MLYNELSNTKCILFSKPNWSFIPLVLIIWNFLGTQGKFRINRRFFLKQILSIIHLVTWFTSFQMKTLNSLHLIIIIIIVIIIIIIIIISHVVRSGYFQKITKIQWLDRRIVTKQPNFDDFEVKYLQIANFSGKKVSFKLKVIFSTKNR